MLEMIEKMTEQNTKQVIILGDFNLPKIDWLSYTSQTANESKTNGFLECLRDCYFTKNVKKLREPG